MINNYLILHREKQTNLSRLRWYNWVTTIYDSIYNINDKHTYSSCLMYYLGSKNEDEFVTTTVKLGYPMLTKTIDHITATAM